MIKEKITPTPGIYMDLEREARTILFDFAIGISRNTTPVSTTNSCLRRVDEFCNKWKMRVPKNTIRGRRCKLQIRTMSEYSMEIMMERAFKFCFHSRTSFHRASFSHDKMREVVRMQTAFYFAKYDEVYNFEIWIASLWFLLTYFELYKKRPDNSYEWIVNGYEIASSIEKFMDDADDTFIKYYNRLKSIPQNSIETVKMHCSNPTPKCADDLTRFFSADMAQGDKIAAICDNWDCCRRSAYNYMKKFGLIEENKRGRKRKKIPYEKLMNGYNTMVEELEALRSIVEDITTLRKENERLKSENDELHIEVEKLLAENETLSYKLFE